MEANKGKGVQEKRCVKRKKRKRKTCVIAENLQHKPKVVKIAHDKCLDARSNYVLFPIGFKYNEDLQSLRSGDIVKFLDGSEHWVESVVRLPIKSAIAEALCKARYGFGITRAVELWQDRLILRKEDIKVMSENECLVLFFDREEVRYEQRVR
jgi:hypothetical protein